MALMARRKEQCGAQAGRPQGSPLQQACWGRRFVRALQQLWLERRSRRLHVVKLLLGIRQLRRPGLRLERQAHERTIIEPQAHVRCRDCRYGAGLRHIARPASSLPARLLRKPQFVQREETRIDTGHVERQAVPADDGFLDLGRLDQPIGDFSRDRIDVVRREPLGRRIDRRYFVSSGHFFSDSARKTGGKRA
jgi:hypothetical protein